MRDYRCTVCQNGIMDVADAASCVIEDGKYTHLRCLLATLRAERDRDSTKVACFMEEHVRMSRERDAAVARALKAETFKTYVHKRLDDAGVPVDPESEHKAKGCRIGGRLDWLIMAADGANPFRAVQAERFADMEQERDKWRSAYGKAIGYSESAAEKSDQDNASLRAALTEIVRVADHGIPIRLITELGEAIGAARVALSAAPAHPESTHAPAPSTSRDVDGSRAGVAGGDAAGVRDGVGGAVDAEAVIRIVNDHKEKSHSWEAHYDLEPCLAADCFSGGGEIYAYGASEAEARENLAIALRFTIERLSAALGAAGRPT